MAFTRRTFFVAAGTTTLALAGGGGAWVATRTPTRALAPWAGLDQPVTDVRLDAFRHAILAPNPHNRQPWQITLVGRDEAIITCDLRRRLPQTDPFDRQITIGFGCFLELARMVAEARGYTVEITGFPQGSPDPLARLDARPVARLVFKAGPTRSDPLLAAIRTRRTSKVPYDLARPIEAQALARIVASASDGTKVRVVTDAVEVAALRAATWTAWRIEADTPRTHQETVDLMRIGKAEVEANPDAVSISGAMLEALAAAGQISRASFADPNSTAFRRMGDRYQPIMATSMGFVWASTTGNSRADQLAAGATWVRANLAATLAGVAFQPVSQALQEYPEMAKSLTDMRQKLKIAPGETLQMLARIGYAPPVSATPRWPLAAKVLNI
jgi:hypothetical protein